MPIDVHAHYVPAGVRVDRMVIGTDESFPPHEADLGDEDEACIDGSLIMKRAIPNAGLLMLPCAGHTINSEEPAAFNAALAEFFAAVEHGRWRVRPAGVPEAAR